MDVYQFFRPGKWQFECGDFHLVDTIELFLKIKGKVHLDGA
jgi:hypothetical protein